MNFLRHPYCISTAWGVSEAYGDGNRATPTGQSQIGPQHNWDHTPLYVIHQRTNNHHQFSEKGAHTGSSG